MSTPSLQNVNNQMLLVGQTFITGESNNKVATTQFVKDTLTAGNAGSATNATNANNVNVISVSNNNTYFPTFVSALSGNQVIDVSSGLTFNPSTGTLSATTFSGNATTQTLGDNSTKIANSAFVNNAINDFSNNNLPGRISGAITDFSNNNLPGRISGAITDFSNNNLPTRISGAITDFSNNNLPGRISGAITDFSNNNLPNRNVASATKLFTARKIGGVDFDGTQDISINSLGTSQLSFFNGSLASKSTVSVPLGIGSVNVTGAPTDASYNLLVTDVSNLRYTLNTLVTALKGYGLV